MQGGGEVHAEDGRKNYLAAMMEDWRCNGAEHDAGEDAGDSLPELTIKPGDVVCGPESNYKISRLIGEGRCCVVYSGETVNSAEPVAVKVFRSGSVYQSAAEREWKVLQLLNNSVPTAVNFYAATRHKGLVCFVFELLDLNIRQLIMKNNRFGLPPWTIKKFSYDMFKFLETLHQHGYVHGDIKPGNIMWSGQDGCFKCFDFGLSFNVSDANPHLTQSTGYRAPEVTQWNKFQETAYKRKLQQNGYIGLSEKITISQSSSKLSIDGFIDLKIESKTKTLEDVDNFIQYKGARPGPKSDIWALGCLLFETILGRKLFRAGDKLSAALRPNQLVELRFDEMKEYFVENGSWQTIATFKDLIMKCLDLDPDSRFSATEALNHPALTSSIPVSRQDNILLPTPVIKFAAVDEGEFESLAEKFAEFGKVVELKQRDGEVYVQYMSLKQAVRAKNYLSNESTRNQDIGLSDDVIYCNEKGKSVTLTKGEKSLKSFSTEYFPLDLWYRL